MTPCILLPRCGGCPNAGLLRNQNPTLMALLSRVYTTTSLVSPLHQHAAGALAVPRAAAPSMGLFNIGLRTSQRTTRATDEEEALFEPLKFLGNVKNRVAGGIKGRWRKLRGKQSFAVTDAILTARLRKADDVTKPVRRYLAEDSWEDMLPEVIAAPRNLAEDSWEDMLPGKSAMPRNLIEDSWEDHLLPTLGDAIVSVPSASIRAAATPAAKHDLAEIGWEERLLPGGEACSDVRAPRQLAETSWEDHLLPPDVQAGPSFKRVGFSSWEDMLP